MPLDYKPFTRNSNIIDVLTIDDHPVIRQGIHHLLEGENDINPVGEIGSIHEALEWLRRHHVDVILLDHNLTDINGVDAIPQLLNTCPDLQIIMFTVSDDNNVFLRAIRNGACGYVLKDTSPDHIIEAIRAAKAGECRVSDSLVRTLFKGVTQGAENNLIDTASSGRQNQAYSSTSAPTSLPVKDSEAEVLKHLLKGLSNKEIAKALRISPNTVRNKLQKLQEQFNARNRVQLALYAYDAGIGVIR